MSEDEKRLITYKTIWDNCMYLDNYADGTSFCEKTQGDCNTKNCRGERLWQ